MPRFLLRSTLVTVRHFGIWRRWTLYEVVTFVIALFSAVALHPLLFAPPVGGTSPRIMFNKDVFPTPDCPMITTDSFACSSRFTFLKTVFFPNAVETSSNRRIGLASIDILPREGMWCVANRRTTSLLTTYTQDPQYIGARPLPDWQARIEAIGPEVLFETTVP